VAIVELYRFLHRQHLISADELEFILEEAGQVDFYKKRIAGFLNIRGDGFETWDAEFPTNF
jgi:hypothetical protein